MNQLFYVPITLSSEFDPTLTFWSAVVPTAAVTLGYWFVLRPVKRKQRLACVLSVLGMDLTYTTMYVASSVRHVLSCARPRRT